MLVARKNVSPNNDLRFAVPDERGDTRIVSALPKSLARHAECRYCAYRFLFRNEQI
jgi:hypothetical protein